MKKIFSLEKIKFFTLLLAIVFLFSLSPQNPRSLSLGIPYGGPATYINPFCVGGSHVIVGPPKPMSIFQSYNASAYRLWGPYILPGQQGLGKAFGFAPCMVPCPVGLCFAGGGPVVMIQGTSKGAGGSAVSSISKIAAVGAIGYDVVDSLSNSDSGGNNPEDGKTCPSKISGHVFSSELSKAFNSSTCDTINITIDFKTCNVNNKPTSNFFPSLSSCQSSLYSCTANGGTIPAGEFRSGSVKTSDEKCSPAQLKCPNDKSRQMETQSGKTGAMWIGSSTCGK